VGILQVLAEVLRSRLMVVRVRVEARAGVVVSAGDWPAAEDIGIGMILAWAVLYCEGELLDHQHPAGRLAAQVLSRHEPFEGLVVCNEGEGDAVQVVPQAAHGPHGSRELPVVAAIIDFMLVKALGNAGDDMLETREGVDLGEYCGHPMVAPVRVQQRLSVAVVVAQDTALLAEQILQLV
jgi:hypothetical protein